MSHLKQISNKNHSLECKLIIINDFEAKFKICELAKEIRPTSINSLYDYKFKEKVVEAVKDAQTINSSNIRTCHGIIAQMETLLWCDNQIGLKNCPYDQNTVCS